MSKNRTSKGSLLATGLLASLLIIFSVGAGSTDTAQTAAKQTEKDWIRYFDMRKDKDGKPIPLAEIEAVAGKASDEADGLVIVSYTDDETTKTYYEYVQKTKDEGKPIVAFFRAPEDEYNSFIIYADGRAIALDDSDGDKNHFNSPSELVMTIEFSIKLIEDGATKRSVPEKDTNDDASLSPAKESR